MNAAERGRPAGARASMYFEDFRVGQRFRSEPRRLSRRDHELFTELSGDANPVHTDGEHARARGFDGPLVHGPLGIAAAFGLLHELGIVETTALAMKGLEWRFLAPVYPGDALRLDLTITRCRRSASRAQGTVGRHFRLTNQHGAVVHEGTSELVVAAREPVRAGHDGIATDFCTPAWAEALAARLQENTDFRGATRTFDGSIGLESGAESVQLRIYRGAVLEQGRSTPLGPTFTLAAPELTWVEMAAAGRNEFIQRATAGHFAVRGDMYAYLRLTKAMVVLWDDVRGLATGSLAT